MLIDTHAHLWWSCYENTILQVIERAKSAGVSQIIVPGIDLKSSLEAIELARKYGDLIKAAVGIHPEELLKEKSGDEVSKVVNLIENNRKYVVAIGEVGMDLFTNELKKIIERQKELFDEMCILAKKVKLPLIIHSRESVKETLEILDNYPTLIGQFHCFGGDEEEAKKVLSRGYYMSFCGNLSWSKRARRLSNLVPLDKLLLETDSPFMTPVNERNEKISRQNEPANVRISLQIISRERKIPLEELEQRTYENAVRLYNL